MPFFPYFVKSDASPFFPEGLQEDAYGLVAIGGNLQAEILIEAYSKGLFPWYEQGPVTWYSPDPRLVLFPQEFHLSRTLQRVLKSNKFRIIADDSFPQVVEACSRVPRKNQSGTWINEEMKRAYGELHRLHLAHSFEVWEGAQLVGGLYGVSLGRAFFGESMFSLRPDSSKVALFHLVQFAQRQGFEFIDCQVTTEHLVSLGAREIPKNEFLELLKENRGKKPLTQSWKALVEG